MLRTLSEKVPNAKHLREESTVLDTDIWASGFRKFSVAPLLEECGARSDLQKLIDHFPSMPADPADALGTRFRQYARGLYFPWKNSLEWIPGETLETGEELAPYFQGEFNPEHVNACRYFEMIPKSILLNRVLSACLLTTLHQTIWRNEDAYYPVLAGVHLIAQRVSSSSPIATVSPNCMHQDGETYDFVILLDREGVDGGENCVGTLDAAGLLQNELKTHQKLEVFTMNTPLEGFGVFDQAVTHGVSELRLKDGYTGGHRYTILVDTVPLREFHREMRS